MKFEGDRTNMTFIVKFAFITHDSLYETLVSYAYCSVNKHFAMSDFIIQVNVFTTKFS